MSMKNMWYMLKHSRQASKIQAMWQYVMDNTNKSCLYCDKSYGVMTDTPVNEFFEHLVNEHPDKVDIDKLQKWIKLFS